MVYKFLTPLLIRATPVILGFAFASRNEKRPPSRMQMHTQAKLPLHLHSLLLDFRQRVNMNWLLLKLNQIIYIFVLTVHPSINRLLLKLNQIICNLFFHVHPSIKRLFLKLSQLLLKLNQIICNLFLLCILASTGCFSNSTGCFSNQVNTKVNSRKLPRK